MKDLENRSNIEDAIAQHRAKNATQQDLVNTYYEMQYTSLEDATDKEIIDFANDIGFEVILIGDVDD